MQRICPAQGSPSGPCRGGSPRRTGLSFHIKWQATACPCSKNWHALLPHVRCGSRSAAGPRARCRPGGGRPDLVVRHGVGGGYLLLRFDCRLPASHGTRHTMAPAAPLFIDVCEDLAAEATPCRAAAPGGWLHGSAPIGLLPQCRPPVHAAAGVPRTHRPPFPSADPSELHL